LRTGLKSASVRWIDLL